MTPRIAIIDTNTLAAIGLRQMLQSVMPVMTVDTFSSFDEFQSAEPDLYFHYFVSATVVLEHNAWFAAHSRKTIVLTTQHTPVTSYHASHIDLPEPKLVRQLLAIAQQGHSGGRNLPATPSSLHSPLSPREVEVLSLIVQGFINKEIAERLHIALATVVTHRKNIMEKLGLKSVSALTIYAVMHGYVDINSI